MSWYNPFSWFTSTPPEYSQRDLDYKRHPDERTVINGEEPYIGNEITNTDNNEQVGIRDTADDFDDDECASDDSDSTADDDAVPDKEDNKEAITRLTLIRMTLANKALLDPENCLPDSMMGDTYLVIDENLVMSAWKAIYAQVADEDCLRGSYSVENPTQAEEQREVFRNFVGSKPIWLITSTRDTNSCNPTQRNGAVGNGPLPASDYYAKNTTVLYFPQEPMTCPLAFFIRGGLSKLPDSSKLFDEIDLGLRSQTALPDSVRKQKLSFFGSDYNRDVSKRISAEQKDIILSNTELPMIHALDMTQQTKLIPLYWFIASDGTTSADMYIQWDREHDSVLYGIPVIPVKLTVGCPVSKEEIDVEEPVFDVNSSSVDIRRHFTLPKVDGEDPLIHLTLYFPEESELYNYISPEDLFDEIRKSLYLDADNLCIDADLLSNQYQTDDIYDEQNPKEVYQCTGNVIASDIVLTHSSRKMTVWFAIQTPYGTPIQTALAFEC